MDPTSRRTGEDSSEAASSAASTPQSAARRRPVPGKGHQKSRKGCFSCKRRRVKCSEEMPRCRACRRIGLDCEYPPPAAALMLPNSSSSLRSTPAALAFEDLRFFHHFLVTAYPPLPFGLDDVWQHVAAMSHEVRRHVSSHPAKRPLLTGRSSSPVRLPRARHARPGSPAPDGLFRCRLLGPGP